MYIARLLQHYI